MALQPVSGVTPLHTANVSFSGRNYSKNENDEYNTSSSRIPASVKTVPVIVLMAMSPLNKVNSTTPYLPEENNIEVVETPEMSPIIRPTAVSGTVTPKQVGSNLVMYATDSKDQVIVLRRLSLDGNDNDYEAVEFVRIDGLNNEKVDILERGLITYVFDGKSNGGAGFMCLTGAKLSKEDPNDFRLLTGGFRKTIFEKVSTNYDKYYYNKLKTALNILYKEPNNNNVFEVEVSDSYTQYNNGFASARRKYQNILGINNGR